MEETHSLNRLSQVNRLGLNNLNGDTNNDGNSGDSTPTISFKDKPEIAEVGKATQIDFLISGKTRWWKNNLKIELLNENKELSFSKTQWDKMDYGFTMLTKVTSNKAGQYKIQFKVDNELTSILYIESKYLTLEEPTVVSDTKVTYTNEQKAKLIATVYGESARDADLMVNIPWIYYNLTKNLGFEKGLKRSSFYKNPRNNIYISESYRICMYYLKQGDQYKDYQIVNKMKVKDYCVDTNSSFVNGYKRKLDIIRSFFEDHIFDAVIIMNPYYGWEGQGFWGDMDFRENNTDKTKWAKASQYYHLQKKGYVKTRYIKEFIVYDRKLDVTTYLCDDKSIEKYFKNNPSDLPQFNNGDYSTIPRVHIPKDLP